VLQAVILDGIAKDLGINVQFDFSGPVVAMATALSVSS
jgi:hypothetical protein